MTVEIKKIPQPQQIWEDKQVSLLGEPSLSETTILSPKETYYFEDRKNGRAFFKVQNIIGRGTFGIVYEVKLLNLPQHISGIVDTNPKQEFALKTGKIGDREVFAMQAIHGEKDIQKITIGKESALLMPYYPGVELTEENARDLTFDERVFIMKSFLEQVKRLHEKNIAHRDIKNGNILFFNRGAFIKVKVIDCGLAESMVVAGVKDTNFCGTPLFIAPEQKQYNEQRLSNVFKNKKKLVTMVVPIKGLEKADIYAMGLSLRVLFGARGLYERECEIKDIGEDKDLEGEYFTFFDEGCFRESGILDEEIDGISKIIDGLTDSNPERRIGIDAALKKLEPVYQSCLRRSLEKLNRVIGEAIVLLEKYKIKYSHSQTGEQNFKINRINESTESLKGIQTEIRHITEIKESKLDEQQQLTQEVYKNFFERTEKILNNCSEKVSDLRGGIKLLLNKITRPLSKLLGKLSGNERLSRHGFFNPRSYQLVRKAKKHLRERLRLPLA